MRWIYPIVSSTHGQHNTIGLALSVVFRFGGARLNARKYGDVSIPRHLARPVNPAIVQHSFTSPVRHCAASRNDREKW